MTSLLLVFEARFTFTFRAFRDPKQTEPACPYRCSSSKNDHERSAKPHPLYVIGWNTINFGLVWLVIPFVFVCDLGAQVTYRDTCFDGLLMGRAASGSWGKIRWMGSFMFWPKISDTTFNIQGGPSLGGDGIHKPTNMWLLRQCLSPNRTRIKLLHSVYGRTSYSIHLYLDSSLDKYPMSDGSCAVIWVNGVFPFLLLYLDRPIMSPEAGLCKRVIGEHQVGQQYSTFKKCLSMFPTDTMKKPL